MRVSDSLGSTGASGGAAAAAAQGPPPGTPPWRPTGARCRRSAPCTPRRASQTSTWPCCRTSSWCAAPRLSLWHACSILVALQAKGALQARPCCIASSRQIGAAYPVAVWRSAHTHGLACCLTWGGGKAAGPLVRGCPWQSWPTLYILLQASLCTSAMRTMPAPGLLNQRSMLSPVA